MKALKRIGLAAVIVCAGTWVAVQIKGRNAPAGLGVQDGSLSECPDSPNCECSDCDRADKMPPLEFSGDPAMAKAALKKALAKMSIAIADEQENYIHSIATTPIMRFRDDLEILIQPVEKKIQFRSASRLGHSDLGKNKARLQELFALLEKDGIRAASSGAQ